MRFNRILSIFVAFFLLSGCELNIEKVNNLRNQNEALLEKNKILKEEIENKNATIKDNEIKISVYIDEIEKHESGIAKERSDQLLIFFKAAIVSIAILIVYMLADFYRLHIKKPKREDIEEHNKRLNSENSTIEKLRDSQIYLENYLQDMRKQIQLTRDDIRQLELEKSQAYLEKKEAELMQQSAFKQLEDLRAEISVIEKKRALLNVFKQK